MNNPGVPHLEKKDTSYQLVVDGKPFLMLAGELHNSSASSLAYLEPIWPRMKSLGLNTVLVPLYWELVEPEEGRFDFALLDGIVAAAREVDLRLVFLWFGTWKNAASSYVPEWVKAAPKRFPRLQYRPGEDVDALSCFSQLSCQADSSAFATVMRRIRQIDEGKHTVLMVQVENEPGVLGFPRDRSAAADAAYKQPVPQELIAYLQAHRESLAPALQRIWGSTGFRASGTWSDAFANVADEVFMAWYVARYIDQVAAAGKAEYDIPLYANAWLIGSQTQRAGDYPSGGPVYRMLDVWKAGAAHIDLLAPDIYLQDFRSACQAYTRPDNPLFIPEAHRDERAAAAVFYALAQHDALGFAPFGIDGVQEPHPLSASYRLLSEMMPVLAGYQGTGRMAGFFQQADGEIWEVRLGDYYLRIKTNQPLQPGRVPGGGLVINLAEDEYLCAGRGLTFEFSKPAGPVNVEFLWAEEGSYENGQWVTGRRLNGDETSHGRIVRLSERLSACRVKINPYLIPVLHQELLAGHNV
jgi:hypothetical protein